MGIIWLLVKTSRWTVIFAILSGIVSGGSAARLIALINTSIEHSKPFSLIAPFTGLVILALITGSLSQFLLIDLAQDSIYQLRLQLSQRILSAPLQQLEKLGANQLLAALTKDVENISNTVFAIPFLCIDAAVVVGCLVYLGWLSLVSFLVVFVFIIAAGTVVNFLIAYVFRFIALSRLEIDRLFQHFGSITDGIKELKLNAIRRQVFVEESLTVTATASKNYQKTALKMGALAMGSGQLLFFLLIGLLLFFIPQVIPGAKAALPAYILTLTYLYSPLQRLTQQLPLLANANVSIKKIEEMGLSLAANAEMTEKQPSSLSNWKKIELRQVMHSYHNEEENHRFTVGPINLVLQAGEIVFIVGGNGSGKSTLAKLITGLYIPNSGEIWLDDQPIADHNREWYRQHFSAVFADFYLFDRLISSNENGAINSTAMPVGLQAQKYLKQLELDRKVSIENNQFSTTALSQGQRKRLALLSAYLEDRSIYLFDEWAADQDPVFREIFYTQLLPELKKRGKTLLVISHDDHFFHLADRIIKLDYGQIESDQHPAYS